MEGHASISSDILARYAADAVDGVAGVRRLVESHLPRHRGIRIDGETVEVHLAVEWGADIPAVGRAVQEGVAEYLERMADLRPAAVNVVVDEIA